MALAKVATTDLLNVTAEQIARCYRHVAADGEVFYTVASESTDATYEVHFREGRGFSCTCPAGQQAFYYCTRGTCKHCRWAVTHANARRQHIARLMEMGLTNEEAQIAVDAGLTVNGAPADDETLARVFRAKNAPTPQEMDEMYQAHPFAILR